jgi:hypothetical protein
MVARCAHTQPSHTHAPYQSCEYCYRPSHGFDDCLFYIYYMSEANKFAHENVPTTTTLVSEEKVVNKVEEKEKQFEPQPNLIRSNDKEVSTEAHSLITIPLETQQASSFQCLEEPSYVEIFKVSRTERCKHRNRHTKKIFRRKQICYIRWRNILPEGYQILKKKGWKGLVGHPYERGRCGIFYFLFSALHF